VQLQAPRHTHPDSQRSTQSCRPRNSHSGTHPWLRQALQATEGGKEQRSQDRRHLHEASIGQRQKKITLHNSSSHPHTSPRVTVLNTRTRHMRQLRLGQHQPKRSKRKMSSYSVVQRFKQINQTKRVRLNPWESGCAVKQQSASSQPAVNPAVNQQSTGSQQAVNPILHVQSAVKPVV
jgi:hypothetical protein